MSVIMGVRLTDMFVVSFRFYCVTRVNEEGGRNTNKVWMELHSYDNLEKMKEPKT